VYQKYVKLKKIESINRTLYCLYNKCHKNVALKLGVIRVPEVGMTNVKHTEVDHVALNLVVIRVP
jgi:hypothetical protein